MTQEENKDYRYKYLEEKVNSHEERIKSLEVMNNEITKISTILEMQAEMNKKQDETLTKINENLTNLNVKSDRLAERVNGLENDVKEVSNRDSISITETMKKIGWLVVTAIVTFVLTYFGL